MSAISENTTPLSPNLPRAAGALKTPNTVENNANQVAQTQISTPANPATLRLTVANPDQETVATPRTANRGSVLSRASAFNQLQETPVQGRPRSNTQVSLPRLENVPSSSNSDQTNAATPRSRGSVLSRASVFNQPQEESPVQGRPRSNTQVSLPKLEIASSSSSSSSSSPANATPRRGSVLNRVAGVNINPLALAGSPRKAPPPAQPVEVDRQVNNETATASADKQLNAENPVAADDTAPKNTQLVNPTKNRVRPQGRRLPTKAGSNGLSSAVNASALNSPVTQGRISPRQSDQLPVAEETVVQAEETVVQAEETVVQAEETVVQAEETVVQAEETVVQADEIAVQVPVINDIAVQAQIVPENIVQTSVVQAHIVPVAINEDKEPAQFGSLNPLFVEAFFEVKDLDSLGEEASDFYLFNMFNQMAAIETGRKPEVINMDEIWEGLEDGTYSMTAPTLEETLPPSIRSFLDGRLVEELDEDEHDKLISLLAAHPLARDDQNPIINMDKNWEGLEDETYSL